MVESWWLGFIYADWWWWDNLGQRRRGESKVLKPDFCATAEPCLTDSYTEKANGQNKCIWGCISEESSPTLVVFVFVFFLIF